MFAAKLPLLFLAGTATGALTGALLLLALPAVDEASPPQPQMQRSPQKKASPAAPAPADAPEPGVELHEVYQPLPRVSGAESCEHAAALRDELLERVDVLGAFTGETPQRWQERPWYANDATLRDLLDNGVLQTEAVDCTEDPCLIQVSAPPGTPPASLEQQVAAELSAHELLAGELMPSTRSGHVIVAIDEAELSMRTVVRMERLEAAQHD